MSKVYTDPTNYSNIADAIREKLGGETTYKPAQMPAAIRAIETEPEIEPLTITENGTYTAPSGTDGYSPITVEVTGGGLEIGDYAVTTESPGIAIEQNLSNWSWYAGVSFPNSYANGINTVTGYSGGGGYERLKKTISGLSRFTWYLFSFKFYSPSGFVDGQYGDPFACAVNSTSSSYPSGTSALNSAYSYINGMTRRLSRNARSTPEEYQILFNTKNQTAAYLSFEFGSITDGVPIDMVFSDLKFEKVLSIRKITAEPTYGPITITENGTYSPEYPILGYAPVTVNVEVEPEISPLVVTENGTYTAPSGTDGYSPITVNVQGGGSSGLVLLESCWYNAEHWNATTSVQQQASPEINVTAYPTNATPVPSSTGNALRGISIGTSGLKGIMFTTPLPISGYTALNVNLTMLPTNYAISRDWAHSYIMLCSSTAKRNIYTPTDIIKQIEVWPNTYMSAGRAYACFGRKFTFDLTDITAPNVYIFFSHCDGHMKIDKIWLE